jgi:hypothetical protein
MVSSYLNRLKKADGAWLFVIVKPGQLCLIQIREFLFGIQKLT